MTRVVTCPDVTTAAWRWHGRRERLLCPLAVSTHANFLSLTGVAGSCHTFFCVRWCCRVTVTELTQRQSYTSDFIPGIASVILKEASIELLSLFNPRVTSKEDGLLLVISSCLLFCRDNRLCLKGLVLSFLHKLRKTFLQKSRMTLKELCCVPLKWCFYSYYPDIFCIQ